MDFHKDYYRILGIEKNATREEIKSAYRKLVMKYHPDRNQDNEEAIEKMKEINEAYEVLDSDISRFVYDEYKSNEERIEKENKQKDESYAGTPKSNKRTYEKKAVVRTERRVYVKGTISVKFWAEQENDLHYYIMKEVSYKLNPVSAEAKITRSDIHDTLAPGQFQKAYKQAELFKISIPNPVKCKILKEDGTQEYYDLSLQDVRVIDPVIVDVTKHEKQSLGTLKGEFYGYVLRVDEHEEIIFVTECFGETGNIERKMEGDVEFFRQEYYNKDCTTYWGPWIEIKKAKTDRKPSSKAQEFSTNEAQGCAQYWWIPILLLFLFVWPQLFIGLLVTGLLGLLFSLGSGLLAKLLPVLGVLLIGFFIYSAFNSFSSSNTAVKRDFRPSYDTLKSTRDPISQDSSSDGMNKGKPDTLINHFIRWKGYDSVVYETTLSVTTTDLKESNERRNSFELGGFYNSLSPVYSYLENSDQSGLTRVYEAFDSIRSTNTLNGIAFAEMVVSCIQSVPYYLVVDQYCDPDYYNDDFISKFLQQCNSECCIGNMKFGVRSPIEFISDLKGDCDTRALIIYSILKRFNYNVALLTSQYYKHALVAVNFENETVSGVAMSIDNKNYYLWETTNVGFRPGQVPAENRNISRWDIALLNKKK